MRKIEIFNVNDDTILIGRKFIDKKSKINIVCAYDANAVCSPECAACSIWGSYQKASCKRVGEGFDIGSLEEKWSNYVDTNYVYKIIYVSGGKKAPFKQIINEHKNRYKGKDLNLKFFDDLESTPSCFPWTDNQVKHHIASYLYRRELGIDRFSLIKNGSRYDTTLE